MKVLITSGGTKVPIDDVRALTNFSSGRYGAEIAEAFLRNLHAEDEVLFFYEKGSMVPCCYKDDELTLTSYADYFDYLSVKEIIKQEQPDIIISAAAVSDFICDKATGKISSDGDEMIIKLRKAEKVIASFRELAPKALIVGFKCLVGPTESEKNNAVARQFESDVDYVVYNDLSELRKGNARRVLFGRVNSQFITQDFIANTAQELVGYILERYSK